MKSKEEVEDKIKFYCDREEFARMEKMKYTDEECLFNMMENRQRVAQDRRVALQWVLGITE